MSTRTVDEKFLAQQVLTATGTPRDAPAVYIFYHDLAHTTKLTGKFLPNASTCAISYGPYSSE
ncbi:hypothetical protein KIN20_032298 [Parelaphostrongylus tenuis]|uniref:Uncharacterized protein n=1 Tax=Parelaphostrongylus tenuis TaxID=148309 RepID=A0AAD5R717_PARTN|nr:hypothetical protein KIN20_032298 [Parelaphostrongylus tenuis]